MMMMMQVVLIQQHCLQPALRSSSVGRLQHGGNSSGAGRCSSAVTAPCDGKACLDRMLGCLSLSVSLCVSPARVGQRVVRCKRRSPDALRERIAPSVSLGGVDISRGACGSPHPMAQQEKGRSRYIACLGQVAIGHGRTQTSLVHTSGDARRGPVCGITCKLGCASAEF